MATATSRLQIQIDAKADGASSAIKGVTADLRGLDSAASTVSSGLGGLAAAAGVAGLVALGQQAVETAAALSGEAAAMRRVEVAALSMAGSQEKLNDLLFTYQDAIGGAVTQGEAMAQIAKLQAIGFADTAQELDEFVTAARGAALATGQAIDYVVSQMQLAIANQSTMRLDQLGLGVTEVKDRMAELKASSHDLTEEQIYQQAIIGALNDKYGDLTDSAEGSATGVEKLSTALRQAREEMALGVSGGVDQAAAMLAQGVSAFVEEMKGGAASSVLHWYEPMLEGVKQLIAEQKEELATLDANSEAYKNLQAEIAKNVEKAKEYATIMGEVSGENQRAAAESGELEGALNRVAAAAVTTGNGMTAAELKTANLARALGLLAAQSDATAAALDGIASSAVGAIHSAASAAVGIMNASDIARIYGENTKNIDAQIKAMEAVGMTTEEIDFRTQEYAKKASLPFDLAVEAAREAEKANKAVGKSVDALSAEYTALQSKVQSVLQGALDPGVGVDPDDVLESMGFPREDAINENARRLADIAKNGLKNQEWLDEFQNEVPDIWKMIRLAQNPQEEAARLLRDFQDGLLTSPIDKEKAKEIVKRQILGDQNMAALANEIAAEIAVELGIPMQQALAATQGTLGTGSGAGTQAATTFSDAAAAGLEDTNGGGMFVDKFIEQMRSKYTLLQTAGRDAGKMWGTSFLEVVGENVPTALIEMLATLVTPSVMAKFAQQGSMQGAAP